MRMQAGLFCCKRVSCLDNGVEETVWIFIDWHEEELNPMDA